jgi:hypothetical protein
MVSKLEIRVHERSISIIEVYPGLSGVKSK